MTSNIKIIFSASWKSREKSLDFKPIQVCNTVAKTHLVIGNIARKSQSIQHQAFIHSFVSFIDFQNFGQSRVPYKNAELKLEKK